MRSVLVVAFWAWVAVALVVLARRLLARFGGGREQAPPAAEAPPDPPATPASTPTETLAAALSGIALPCDLAPLTSVAGEGPTDRYAVLASSGHPAEAVGRGLASELSRLGYRLEPIGDDKVVAERGATRLSVVIHPDPDDVLVGGRPAFPTAPDGAVVVELRLT